MPSRSHLSEKTLRCRIVHQGRNYFVKLPVQVHRRITEPELVATRGPAQTVEYRSNQAFDEWIAELAARKTADAKKLTRHMLATLSVAERPSDGLLELPTRLLKGWKGDVPVTCVVIHRSPDFLIVCREDRLAEFAAGPSAGALVQKSRTAGNGRRPA